MHIASDPGVMCRGSLKLGSAHAVAAQVTSTPGTQLDRVQSIPFKAQRHWCPGEEAVGSRMVGRAGSQPVQLSFAFSTQRCYLYSAGGEFVGVLPFILCCSHRCDWSSCTYF